MKFCVWIDLIVQCTWTVTLVCLFFELLPFVYFHTWILSGAYLQDYTSYGYEILWVDRSHQGGVHCTWTLTLACLSFELLPFLSFTGRRPASLCHGPLSVLRPSICLAVHPSIRLCINFFFKHLLLWNYLSDFDKISQKCSCHGPLQNFLKKFDSVKNCGCHGNKTEKKIENFENLLVRNHEA